MPIICAYSHLDLNIFQQARRKESSMFTGYAPKRALDFSMLYTPLIFMVKLKTWLGFISTYDN